MTTKEQLVLERIQRMLWIPNFHGLVLGWSFLRARQLFQQLSALPMYDFPKGTVFRSSTLRAINEELNSYVDFASSLDPRETGLRYAGIQITNGWYDDPLIEAWMNTRVRSAQNFEGRMGVERIE